MASRDLPALTATTVIALQDALLSNANRLLEAAALLLENGQVALARSLAVLGLEESGKAIVLHERRVEIAFDPEGADFVTKDLRRVWANHTGKLDIVHQFLVQERYWFGEEPADPDDNAVVLGLVKDWSANENSLKQRGFYVGVQSDGIIEDPIDFIDAGSVRRVIERVHQIGWQLRLGEHIEAKSQAALQEPVPPADEEHIRRLTKLLGGGDAAFVERFAESLRQENTGTQLHNDAYRLMPPSPDESSLTALGAVGHEAETRELLALLAGTEKPGRPDATEKPEEGQSDTSEEGMN